MINSDQVRSLLDPHGELKSQPASDWTGEIALPQPVAEFYKTVGPVNVTVESCGNPIFFPSLANLWEHQRGYRFGLKNEPLPGWDPGLVVVADEGADPFAIKNNDPVVLSAMHGTGSWDFDEAYPDLNTFAAGVGLLGTIIVEAGMEFTNDDGDILNIYIKKGRSGLQALLGDDDIVELVLALNGWVTN